jgi:hypothetical protein
LRKYGCFLEKKSAGRKFKKDYKKNILKNILKKDSEKRF